MHECNLLEDLPEGLSGLTSLQTLDLSCCINLTELPAGIGNLGMLQVWRTPPQKNKNKSLKKAPCMFFSCRLGMERNLR